MTQPEINELMAVLETRGTDPEQRELFREFLQNDTGDDFVMLNLIELNRNASEIAAYETLLSPNQELLNRQLAGLSAVTVFPELLGIVDVESYAAPLPAL